MARIGSGGVVAVVAQAYNSDVYTIDEDDRDEFGDRIGIIERGSSVLGYIISEE